MNDPFQRLLDICGNDKAKDVELYCDYVSPRCGPHICDIGRASSVYLPKYDLWIKVPWCVKGQASIEEAINNSFIGPLIPEGTLMKLPNSHVFKYTKGETL